MQNSMRTLGAASAVMLALLLAAAGVPHAQNADPEEEARYRACMELAEAAPGDALEAAETWVDLGGSDPARHCAAVALMRLGHSETAAQELETLAASL